MKHAPAAEKHLPGVARGVVLPENEVLEGGQEDHHDWRRKQDATGDQAPLLLRENGDGGVDVDDSGACVDQGHQHQQILKAEDAGLSKVLTPHLQQSKYCL